MPRLARLAVLLPIVALAGRTSAQASWQIAYPPQSPPANRDWAAAFDEARGEAIITFPVAGNSNQGWRWNGTTWSQLATLPPNRFQTHMVYDAARARVVLWGGIAPGGALLQDLWEWDGTAWQQRTAAMPPARYGAAIAYDRSRGVTVMFGGYSGTGLLQDTWEWDGLAWSNPNPSVRPSPRESAEMAFDPTGNRVLMYGGSGTVDTWSWNGATWQQHFPATPPTLRLRHSMVADLLRARVVLHGGSAFDPQTWEWDGAEWQSSTPGTPGALLGSACVYDTDRQLVLLHGGEDYGIGSTNLTWTYRTPTPATSLAFGAGCAGSSGVPSLAVAPYSLPWLGDTVRTRVANIAQTSIGSLFVTSFAPSFLPMSLAPLGAPGCDLYLQPDAIEFRTPVGLVVDWTLAIPSTPSLAGVALFQQALPVDVTANPLGLTATNGLRLNVGIR